MPRGKRQRKSKPARSKSPCVSWRTARIISDNAFRLIVQAVTIARFGAAVFNNTEVRYD